MSELLQKLKKNAKLDRVSVLSESDFFIEKPAIKTQVPILNIAMGGSLEGGITPGLTIWAGPSRHFKTSYVLLCLKSYLDSDPEAIGIWFDSEFGSPQSYFEAFGIDTNRVLHIPIMDIEEFKFESMNQLNILKRGDKVMICVDSLGNLASKKEVEDALSEKSVADMTRAKQLKSAFRMITPLLTKLELPMHVVSHTYATMEIYSKQVVSGGCLVADTKIVMSDGTLKNVQDILPGEFVKTLNGPKEVTHSWTPETLIDGTPECYEVTFEDGYSVTCSANHPFLTTEGWVSADKLQNNQNVVCLIEDCKW